MVQSEGGRLIFSHIGMWSGNMSRKKVVIAGVAVLVLSAGTALAQRANKPGAVERSDSATEAPAARSLTAPKPGAAGSGKPDTGAKDKGEKKDEGKGSKKSDEKKK